MESIQKEWFEPSQIRFHTIKISLESEKLMISIWVSKSYTNACEIFEKY